MTTILIILVLTFAILAILFTLSIMAITWWAMHYEGEQVSDDPRRITSIPDLLQSDIQLTADEVASLAGMSTDWVRDHANALGGEKVDGKWMFPNQDLHAKIRQIKGTPR